MSVARPKMGEATPDGLTGREAEIMDRLWKLGAATAEQIREGLSGKPHDSTVRTLLRILEEKECVRHRRDRRSFVTNNFPVTQPPDSVLEKGDRHRLIRQIHEETQAAPEPVPVLQQPATG